MDMHNTCAKTLMGNQLRLPRGP